MVMPLFLHQNRWVFLCLAPMALAMLLAPEGVTLLDSSPKPVFWQIVLGLLWLGALVVPPMVAAALDSDDPHPERRFLAMIALLSITALTAMLAGAERLNGHELPPVVNLVAAAGLAVPWLTARSIPGISRHHRLLVLSSMIAVPAGFLTGGLIAAGIWLVSTLFGQASLFDKIIEHRLTLFILIMGPVLVAVLLVRDGRAEALALWFWRLIMPLGVIVGVASLLSFPLTGWEGLRTLKSPAVALTVLAMLLVMTAGREDQIAGRWLTAARLLVLPLALLAAIAVGLRLAQYGFTQPRAYALLFILIALVSGVRLLLLSLPGAPRFDEGWIVGATPLLALAAITFIALPGGGDTGSPAKPEMQFTIHPAGRSLPNGLKEKFDSYQCSSHPCHVILTDIDGDGREEAILPANSGIYRQTGQQWELLYRIDGWLDTDTLGTSPAFSLKPRTEMDLMLNGAAIPLSKPAP